jgi:hypothetical protein
MSAGFYDTAGSATLIGRHQARSCGGRDLMNQWEALQAEL